MRLYRIRGGNKEDLLQKKYNIAVGVSLGNKWFTPENIVMLAKCCLQYTRNNIAIVPADEIHAINLEVRNRKNKEKALDKVRKMSANLITEVKDMVRDEIPADKLKRIRYNTWKDVRNNIYKHKVQYLYEQYEKPGDFQDAIHNMVKNVIKNEKRSFTKSDVHKLGTYIIEELPEVSARVPIGGIYYDAYAYPFDSELTKFIEDLQDHNIFPEIGKNLIDTKPKVFLEVR